MKRAKLPSEPGLVLSAAGASVGLGEHLALSLYLAAKYGGGIFLLIYIILALPHLVIQ